ncbi:uncharacterized protein RSE6_06412 [Rhynchosporium secalis]|uniref:DnaJ homologue subfamily C member 28 conserved domain-containing protein n=1 Tax=Rhynchosporium secalis TaxID=38038 RepID=A0A1E1MAD7_RHYSE|nr:uncharacterized protein RSE6_06412 [Rhynchosporium secalis]
MPVIRYPTQNLCVRSLRSSHHVLQNQSKAAARGLSQYSPLRNRDQDGGRELKEVEEQASLESTILSKASKSSSNSPRDNVAPQPGAMSWRLAEAAEEALLEGGRVGKKAIEESGFSEELKSKLLEKIETSRFRSENATAFVEAGLNSDVGQGSRQIATGQAWTGHESPQDSMLRMLDDARKSLAPNLRGKAKIPSPVIDLRLKPKPKQKPGERLANARDKTSIYSISKDSQMSDKEREQMRRDLKDRFGPGVGTMPTSFRGLAALANERIEDAIARGQFKNIPRGKAIVRDARADNPFIDTTEYIMNKMIQRQDIVPPWIEKQQEVVKTANIFRARLRNDWKRIAARTIASRGGSLDQQIRRCDLYAQAERIYNPKKKAVEQVSVPATATDDPVLINIVQEVPSTMTELPPVQVLAETKECIIGSTEVPNITSPDLNSSSMPIETKTNVISSHSTSHQDVHPQTPVLPALFRIPSWEQAERSYLTLAIENLNSLTRSYNLMAPELAKKPYYSLERELRSCYADVAPQLSQAIRERAARPAKELVEKIGHRPGGVLDRFASDKAVIYDSKKPLYGFKEFWSDLWGQKGV